jgi:hypothetical protein
MPLIQVGLNPLTNGGGQTTSWTVTVSPTSVQVRPAGPGSTITWSLGPTSGSGPTAPYGAALATVVFGVGPGGTAFPGGSPALSGGLITVADPGNPGAAATGAYVFPYTVSVTYNSNMYFHDPEIVNSPPSG